MRDWPLVGAATMRALDRHTIETIGVPGEVLMESAGRAVVEVVLAERAAAGGGDVLVVCGGGNNGGDGLVVARHLALLGVPVRVALVAPRRGAPSGDAAANLERARRAGVAVVGPPVRAAGASVVVDALFGTGLARTALGDAAAAIRRINAARPAARVVAVDLPSGLDADTGAPLGVCVQADVTVAIALPKLGLALEPGRSRAGRIVVARIGIADTAPGVEADAELWTAAGAAARLPARPADGHKGAFGHVLVVAGSRGKTGAAVLTAEGAVRTGAGLVTIACAAGVLDVVAAKTTECMTAPLPDTAEGSLAAAGAGAVLALARERDVVAIGPGLGREAETQKLVRELALRIPRPLVLDADGLFPFGAAGGGRGGAEGLGALKARKAATILTPHPGEAGRLLGVSAAEINRDRVAAARRLAAESGAVVVLKGAGSVIAAPPGGGPARSGARTSSGAASAAGGRERMRVVVNPTGGPALATGGTGDVLTGVVAALLGQGIEAFEAAAVATWIHGAAADRLAAGRGDAGLLAGEIARALPEVLHALRSGEARCSGTDGAHGAGLAPAFP